MLTMWPHSMGVKEDLLGFLRANFNNAAKLKQRKLNFKVLLANPRIEAQTLKLLILAMWTLTKSVPLLQIRRLALLSCQDSEALSSLAELLYLFSSKDPQSRALFLKVMPKPLVEIQNHLTWSYANLLELQAFQSTLELMLVYLHQGDLDIERSIISIKILSQSDKLNDTQLGRLSKILWGLLSSNDDELRKNAILGVIKVYSHLNPSKQKETLEQLAKKFWESSYFERASVFYIISGLSKNLDRNVCLALINSIVRYIGTTDFPVITIELLESLSSLLGNKKLLKTDLIMPRKVLSDTIFDYYANGDSAHGLSKFIQYMMTPQCVELVNIYLKREFNPEMQESIDCLFRKLPSEKRDESVKCLLVNLNSKSKYLRTASYKYLPQILGLLTKAQIKEFYEVLSKKTTSEKGLENRDCAIALSNIKHELTKDQCDNFAENLIQCVKNKRMKPLVALQLLTSIADTLSGSRNLSTFNSLLKDVVRNKPTKEMTIVFHCLVEIMPKIPMELVNKSDFKKICFAKLESNGELAAKGLRVLFNRSDAKNQMKILTTLREILLVANEQEKSVDTVLGLLASFAAFLNRSQAGLIVPTLMFMLQKEGTYLIKNLDKAVVSYAHHYSASQHLYIEQLSNIPFSSLISKLIEIPSIHDPSSKGCIELGGCHLQSKSLRRI